MRSGCRTKARLGNDFLNWKNWGLSALRMTTRTCVVIRFGHDFHSRLLGWNLNYIRECMRLRQAKTAGRHFFDINLYSLNDTLASFCTGPSGYENRRKVRNIGTDTAIRCCFVDYGVFVAHCSMPACFRTARNMPTGTSAPSECGAKTTIPCFWSCW